MRVSTFLLIFVTIFPFFLSAQISEEFTDGDFTNSPTWQGDETDFAVNSEMLQVTATVAGNSYLSTPTPISDSTFWEFLVELDFNPSTNGNFPKYYLSSDNPDLETDLNGYYLRIGETGSLDAFEIYRQNGNTDEFLFRFSTEGAMASSSNNNARIRITRNDIGVWNCYADYDGGTCFGFEGSFMNNDLTTGDHFGIAYQFTSSNIDNFFIDDIFVDALPTYNNNPLALSSINAIDVTDIQVIFTLPLDLASAETTINYTIKDDSGTDIGNPTIANIDATNPNIVHIDISNLSIGSGLQYTLCVTGLFDCSGNLIGTNNTENFTVFIIEAAAPGDILINEIMADPEPSLGSFPSADFIELYNRSNKAIDLDGFLISDPASSSFLGPKIMPPFSYLIICDDEFATDFMAFGEVLAVGSFPSLNISDDEITLEDPTGFPIDQVHYFNDWYQDEDKEDGGWTLELINPNLYCQGATNWIASQNSNGGTPGQQNSAFEDTPDLIAPKLISATAVNNNQLLLVFDEIMASTDLISTLGFEITSGLGAVNDLVLIEPDKTSYLLSIEAPFFQDQVTYNILVQSAVTDCTGNSVSLDFRTLDFIYNETEAAEPYDILISEIFADPTPSIGLPEAEYLELYNRSNKIINLEGFVLSDPSDDILLPFYIMSPGDYLIVYLKDSGFFGPYGDTLALNDFVGLGNTADNLELINPDGELIHNVIYTDASYQDASKDDGGWSLELINFNAPCSFEDNWKASTSANGGTPGTVNSVAENILDDSPLDLIRAFPITSNQVQLFFNKSLNRTFAADINNYEIDGLTISNVFAEAPSFNTAIVELSTDFDPDLIYEIRVKSELTDCIGNSPGIFMQASFALPKVIEELDLVINEVLYNPETGGVDFVELYNRSDKVVNLADLNIAKRNEENLVDDAVPIDLDCLLFPDEYIVLTKDPLDIKNRYLTENQYGFLTVAIPTYADKEDVVTLYRPAILGEVVIDELAYDDTFPYALLSDKNGVSLERINPNALTQTTDNWHSAAEQVGFATPTYQNSQFLLTDTNVEEFIWLENPRLSPDEDGFEDFLLINYALPSAGYAANLSLFDSKGRLVRDLLQNSLLASEGTIKWDGLTNEGSNARAGIYVLSVNLHKPNGDTIEFKKAIVLATQLK